MLVLRLIGLIAVLGSSALAFTPAIGLLSRAIVEPAEVGPAQAIVVLGGAVDPEGTPGHSSVWRALEGIRLFHRGLAPILVFLGAPGERRFRADLARMLGVADRAIVAEGGGWTTQEEAAVAAAVLGRRDLSRILLVTDSLHMRRARAVFQAQRLDVLAAPADDFPSDPRSPEARFRLARRILEEMGARLYYRLAGFI